MKLSETITDYANGLKEAEINLAAVGNDISSTEKKRAMLRGL